MKVKVFGFEWIPTNGITIDDFCFHLASISGHEINDKMLAITFKNDYWIGVFVTIKDMKSFCKIKRDRGTFTISPEKLEDNSRIVDFNFFILNPLTGRGLYQYYHQSAGSNTFCNFCKKQYNLFKQSVVKKEIEEAGGNNIGKSDLKRIKNKHKGFFQYSTLVKPESFKDCVTILKRIKDFTYEFSSISASEKAFTPAPGFVKRCSHKVFFVEDTLTSTVDEIKAGIIGMVGNDVKAAKVRGVDDSGEEAVYKLINYATFDQIEYEEIIDSVEIDSKDLVDSVENSPIIDYLVKVASRTKVKQTLSLQAK